jgi:hypothetical protein
VVKLAASGKRPDPLPGTGMTESSLSSIDQAQVVRICLPEQASAKEPEHAPNGGSRATAVTSDRHAARLALKRVSDLIAEPARKIVGLR